MENRTSSPDTIYNIASKIADSAFGVLYEDNQGRIGYADALHRQNYLANNGYTDLSANTAIGAGALFGYPGLSTGYYNTAVGYNALKNNRSGTSNSALGHRALYANQTGSKNVAIGYGALSSITAGSGSVAIGNNSAILDCTSNPITSLYTSVVIGYDARVQNSGNYNSIVIGHGAKGSGSNTTTIGRLTTTLTCFSGGSVQARNFVATTGSGIGFAGTASCALNALSASWVPGGSSVSASYAATASVAVSASWAPSAGGAAFPFTGSAQITGSLGVKGVS